MSSIIKSGSAPSNTADGKYFLQTDQACYAELKRGRTYIMTAQEEAKVSHYVIITNADFTVTFNGDSDLVQVGRANNAIVMMVHRACRIDFTQGGNLEFKEGTAEFSSRITMGPNASGNVLVAASLPQQGDFAGQICSLTTGATYVWTGSQWSSTAGVSTLPSVSSAGLTLMSSGPNTWVAKTIPAWRTLKSSGTGVSGKWAVWKILKVLSTEPGPMHFGFDIQFGTHVKSSRKAHVDVFSNTRTFDSTNTVVFETPSGQPYASSVLSPVHLRVYTTADAELCIAILADGSYAMRASIFDFVSNDAVEYYGTSSGQITESTTDVESETGYTLSTMKYFCSTPVSTAANQMLVSDGNGGWSATNNKNPFGVTLPYSHWETASSVAGNTSLLCIGRHVIPQSSTSTQFYGHVNFMINFGTHTKVSYKAFVDCILYHAYDGTNIACGTVVTTLPSWTTAYSLHYNTAADSDLTRVAVYAKVNSDNPRIVDLYLGLDYSVTGWGLRFTIQNMFGDEDFVPNVTAGTSVPTVATANLASLGYYGTEHYATSQTVPTCSSADNGKVLKVVSGVPTWTSA